MPDPCPFCDIVNDIRRGTPPAGVVEEYKHSFVLIPREPVVPGHVLVIPYRHSRDFAQFMEIAANTMGDAAFFAANTDGYEECNVITSRGEAATQTVFHLHLHVVPRHLGDGLHLPWTGQERTPQPPPYDWHVQWPTAT